MDGGYRGITRRRQRIRAGLFGREDPLAARGFLNTVKNREMPRACATVGCERLGVNHREAVGVLIATRSLLDAIYSGRRSAA